MNMHPRKPCAGLFESYERINNSQRNITVIIIQTLKQEVSGQEIIQEFKNQVGEDLFLSQEIQINYNIDRKIRAQWLKKKTKYGRLTVQVHSFPEELSLIYEKNRKGVPYLTDTRTVAHI